MQESSLAKIPQVDVKLELDDPPTRKEIKKATKQLKVGYLPGIVGIPAEVYQHAGEAVLHKLHDTVHKLLGERDSTAGHQGCSHRLSIQKKKKQGEKSDFQTIEASLCSPLQAESWLASC